jgi:hypothetical protein
MELTIERLNGEYLNWSLQWGQGRNDQDLRFGQFLDWKYDLKLHLSDRSVGLFYNESVDEVYNEILRVLQLNNVQNTR